MLKALFKMLKALIVDDNTLFRRCLNEILQAQFPGMRIVELADGHQVLEKVEDLMPNVIFLDVNLPGINGLELTKKIKAAHAAIPIVIATSYNQPEYREAAQKAGADHFFAKDEMDEHKIETLVKSFISDSIPPRRRVTLTH
jgi:DNA-binding NarL/FixJ family response regulator